MAASTETRMYGDISIARLGPIGGDAIDRRAVVDEHAKSRFPIGDEGWYRIGAARRTTRAADTFDHELRPAIVHPPSEVGVRFEHAPHARSIVAVGDPAPCHRLTRRERQVLQLVASGCTDRQIGDHLCIGARTAEWHLANIFNKLGLSTSAAASAYAVRHGLA